MENPDVRRFLKQLPGGEIPPHIQKAVDKIVFLGWNYRVVIRWTNPPTLQFQQTRRGGRDYIQSTHHDTDIPNEIVAAGALDPWGLRNWLREQIYRAVIIDANLRMRM